MIKKILLLTGLINTHLIALNNPFSCSRTIINPPKTEKSLLQNFHLLGIVKTETQRQAIVQWENHTETLLAGNTIGPIKIQEIFDQTIRIVTAKKEYILTLDSE